MFKELFIAFIVSIDIYLIAVSCRSSGIFIPHTSALLINIISAGILGISIGSASVLIKLIPEHTCHLIGMSALIIIGVITILKSVIRTLAAKKIDLKMGDNVIIRLYLDDTAADFDNSKIISLTEAAALAVACSLDAAAVGLSSGLNGARPLSAAIAAFFLGCFAIFAGNVTGKKISSLDHDFSWLGGVFIIIFAVFV